MSETRNTEPGMPLHFIPELAPYLSRQLFYIQKEFSDTDLDDALIKAIKKLSEQSIKNLPNPGDIENREVTNFLRLETGKTDEFKALKNEYTKLQNLHDYKRSIESYEQSVQTITQNIHKKFAEYLKKEKEAFHKAYATVCPDEVKRKALWEMYATNLRVNMLKPLEQFTKDIDGLVPQAFIYYVNQLGEKDTPSMTYQTGKTKEKLKKKLHYQDSNDMPITIIKDKKTGELEIRVSPLSPTWLGFNATSGDLGDAAAILVAYHGKEVPIKIAVPISQLDYLRVEMDPGFTQALTMLIAWSFKKLQQIHYKNHVVEDAVKKGLSLDNISLVDNRGNPIVFTAECKAKVKEELEKREEGYAKFETEQEARNPQRARG